MAGSTDNAEVELTCETCGATRRKSLRWTQDHDEFTGECRTLIPVDVSKFERRSRRPRPRLTHSIA